MKIDDKEALLTGFIVFLFYLLFSVCIEYTYRCLQIKNITLKKLLDYLGGFVYVFNSNENTNIFYFLISEMANICSAQECMSIT